MVLSSIRNLFRSLASLKLTVILLALSMFLVFAGTLAQVEQGIWTVMASYFRTPIAWIPLQLFVPRQVAEIPAAIPFPGGFLLGALLMVNLLAAHAVRFKFSWKRSGIVVMHLGIIVLLASEFVTGLLAEEGLMTIDEGQSSNYIEDIRESELVFLESIGDGRDRVIAVPQAKLVAAARGERRVIQHASLPFEIEVQDWMPNSRIVQIEENVPARAEVGATAGSGLRWNAERLPRVTGLDGQVDAPSALITLRRQGESLGTWLVSLHLNPVQVVTVDVDGGRDLRLGMRFKRTYKPYTLHLWEFRHDRFVGTERPRNFSSRLQLTDPLRGVDREVLIRMNQPLRYAGVTFYQSAYKEGDFGTILQVVRNPGWLLPYISCTMVGLGMLWHFGLRLGQFLRRPAGGRASVRVGQPARPLLRRAAIPFVMFAAAGLFVAGSTRPDRTDDPYELQRFGTIPVSADGRIKPLDTVARTSLMIISGRQSFSVEDGGKREPAIRWLADVMARTHEARDYRVFRIDHPDVRQLIERESPHGDVTRAPERERPYYSIAEIMPHWSVIIGQAERAVDIPPRQRDPFQRQIMTLYRQVMTFMDLSQMHTPYMVPPTGPGTDWAPFFRVMHDSVVSGETNPGVTAITAMMSAYHQERPEAFVAAKARYLDAFAEHMPELVWRAEFEVFFNRLRPFYLATVLYVIAFLLSCGSLLTRAGVQCSLLPEPGVTRVFAPGAGPDAGSAGGTTPGTGGVSQGTGDRLQAWGMMLARSAFWLIFVTFLLHTFGLLGRMYLQGRPPVTNLYSSAIFVGWGTVLLAMFLERIYRLGLGSLAASAVGAVTLIIAHNLAGEGDTLEMMQAVLDSNFWLSTHVITITIGYSATFLAGFLAMVYIALSLTGRLRQAQASQAMAKMVYGTICFALLFSFVGTVLGGIWADQSWGRFWGWDPKENGAALIVLLQAIILHARWGGLIRVRGMMVLAVAGNIVTAWAWFGTNMLGVGLHSYGFMESAVFWLMAFVMSQLAIMGLGGLVKEVSVRR